MTLLGQQELLTPAPRRRLIVQEGRTAWWGVDSSTLRVAIAGVAVGAEGYVSRWVRTESFPPLQGPARLSAIYRLTFARVQSLATCVTWPGVVFIEQPSGSNQEVNLPLIYAVGVIQAAVHDALVDVTGAAPEFDYCTASWWKKRACGRGNLYKPTKKKLGRMPAFEDYGVAVWARENGYTGSSWDEADAWGIAEAARREVLLEVR